VLLSPADSWKVVLAIALLGTIVASAWARPPRRAIPTSDLRRLVLGAMALYGVGLAASLAHHLILAVALSSGGIGVSALAAWLSRGTDYRGGPPPEDEPVDEQPPPGPDGAPRFDWPAFERELEAYSREAREPAETR
jgi:hypothetical protein